MGITSKLFKKKTELFVLKGIRNISNTEVQVEPISGSARNFISCTKTLIQLCAVIAISLHSNKIISYLGKCGMY